MKKKHLFAISLIGLALAACSTDNELNAGGNQSNEGAVVTLKLDMAGSQTKGSPGATNEQEGTDAENAISNVTVVVDYGNTTQKVFKSSDNYDTGYGWISDSKTFKFKTPAGYATFYVYANVNEADNLSSNWDTDLVSNATVSAYYANNSFFMSNQNGVGKTHTINEDTENNVTVNIERAAAKVTVESPADFTSTYGGKLSDMKFALGNKINKFYLLQQSTIASPTSEVQYLPANDQTADNDWKTVNLGKTSETGVNHQDLSAFTADYCMENVHSTYAQENTTFIKFKTTFTPAKALDFETSYSGNWTVKGDLKNVSAPASASVAPSFFVVLDGNAEYTSNYILKSDLYGDDNQPKSGLSISPAEGGGNTITGITGITKISDEYVSGQCFFGPIWINLNTVGDASPIYRNDWYHLKVTDIKLPGLPSEPGDGGNIPLTPDVDVTLTLTVLDWELEEREIVLQ